MKNVIKPSFLQLSAFIDDTAPIRHGFFGRTGGVSTAPYESLNCSFSTEDSRENVIENRTRMAHAMGVDYTDLVTLHQTHSNICKIVTHETKGDIHGTQADALATDNPELLITVSTADCVPVLFYTQKTQPSDYPHVIGAAHAGWQGALNGVLENTVQAMLDLGGDINQMRCAIGPCIGQNSYEISEDFLNTFKEKDINNSRFFIKSKLKSQKHHFDIGGYAESRLKAAGVSNITNAQKDTCALKDEYFSHRRATLNGDIREGRQLSVIKIEKQ